MNKSSIGTISGIIGGVVGFGLANKFSSHKMLKTKEMSDKHFSLFLMMNQWVKIKQEGKNLCKYFLDNNYKDIAIYGMSYVGETLVEELRNTEINIKYGIDKNADTIFSDIELTTIEESLEMVDVVVVTAITYFDEVAEKLSKKLDCPIISLEDILYEI